LSLPLPPNTKDVSSTVNLNLPTKNSPNMQPLRKETTLNEYPDTPFGDRHARARSCARQGVQQPNG
jgi:hypothetical protein